ncbi:hypothetical protein PoB_002191500 [Plakobranchus ocellatus]|uniref:Uncharacterized protein n=1 Tax=Plakobranchus ocellatus TaxID=259542 RepID=A0AAV3ZLG8_9GAST|nr:hypothetical protein PoB_002191500 [Plakobranchus ocellatus]
MPDFQKITGSPGIRKQRATIKHGLPDLTVTRIISLENLRRRETTRVLRATVTYSPNYPTDITPSPHFRTAALGGGCVYSPVITLSRITLTIEPTQTMPVSVCHFPSLPPTIAPFHGQRCRSGHVHASDAILLPVPHTTDGQAQCLARSTSTARTCPSLLFHHSVTQLQQDRARHSLHHTCLGPVTYSVTAKLSKHCCITARNKAISLVENFSIGKMGDD